MSELNEQNEQNLIPLGETGFENEAYDNSQTPGDLGGENVTDMTGGYFGKPEVYDYSEVELPENYCYDDDLLNEFNELAAKYNLSQKSANELMGIAVKLTKLTGDNYSKTIAEQQRQKVREYKRALMNDNGLGRGNFENTMQTANLAYNAFADSEVQHLLNESGLNCHPKIVQMFWQIGKNMQNDSFYGVNSAPVIKENPEDILYPTMN